MAQVEGSLPKAGRPAAPPGRSGRCALPRGGAVGVLPGAGHVEGLPLLGAGAGDCPLQGQGLEGLLHLVGEAQDGGLGLGGTMFSRVPPEKAATRGRAVSWGQAAWKVGLVMPFLQVDDGKVRVRGQGVGGKGWLP